MQGKYTKKESELYSLMDGTGTVIIKDMPKSYSVKTIEL